MANKKGFLKDENGNILLPKTAADQVDGLLDATADSIQGSMLLAADLNEAGTKIDVHFDLTGSAAGKVPKVNSAGTGMEWGNIDRINYVTTAPVADNNDGIKIAVLSSNPATKYNGWLYIITGE